MSWEFGTVCAECGISVLPPAGAAGGAAPAPARLRDKPPWPEQRDGQGAAAGSKRQGRHSCQPRRGQGAPALRSSAPWGHPATELSQAEPVCLTQISPSSNPAVPHHLGQGEAVAVLLCPPCDPQGAFQTSPPSSTPRPPSPRPCFRDSEARWHQQLASGSPKS